MSPSVPIVSKMPRRCLPALSTHSLGCASAGHDLETKLRAAASHHISGVELYYDDLQAFASSLVPSGGEVTSSTLITAAKKIRDLAESLYLTIIDLQPFLQYEGLLSRTNHEVAIDRAKLWLQLANALGTDLILISSTFLPATECTGDLATIVEDMTELADLGKGQDPPIRFAYENLCWGTHIDSWDGVHAVVSAVDRWNFGYCLDTFNIAGRVYADPSSPDGMTENAEVAMVESLATMVNCVAREKIFLIQVVDAERVSPPLMDGHPWYDGSMSSPSPSPRMCWSRKARLFPFEEERGGYLPVLDVLRALLQGLGYRGWVSVELFSRTLSETRADVPEEHALRAERSWGKLIKAFPHILADESVGDSVAIAVGEQTEQTDAGPRHLYAK